MRKGKQIFYGWFEATGTVPAYDPPHDAPCLYCGTPVHAADVRTKSAKFVPPTKSNRSYFYRTHRTCDEAATSETAMDIFILDMIRRNGD